MNINKTNYESWFLDYYEGTLTAMQVAELFLFLEQHTKLKTEFDSFHPIKITPPEESVFDAKEALKRNVITVHNLDYYLVAEMEKDLNLSERTQLMEFLKLHPEVEKDRELFNKTKVQGTTEVFQGKKALKRKIIKPLYLQRIFWAAAAAIVVFVLGIIYINRPEDTKQTVQQNSGKAPLITNDITHIGNGLNRNPVNGNLAVNPFSTLKKNRLGNLPEDKKDLAQQPLPVKNNYLLSHSRYSSNKKQVADKQPRIQHMDNNNSISGNEEEMVTAQRKESIIIDYPAIDVTPVKRNADLASVNFSATPTAHQRLTIDEKIGELKDVAAAKVNQTAGEEILYSQLKMGSETADRIPLKSRMIKLLAWAVNKLSGERIHMKTEFDPSGDIAAYEISAGKLRVERNF